MLPPSPYFKTLLTASPPYSASQHRLSPIPSLITFSLAQPSLRQLASGWLAGGCHISDSDLDGMQNSFVKHLLRRRADWIGDWRGEKSIAENKAPFVWIFPDSAAAHPRSFLQLSLSPSLPCLPIPPTLSLHTSVLSLNLTDTCHLPPALPYLTHFTLYICTVCVFGLCYSSTCLLRVFLRFSALVFCDYPFSRAKHLLHVQAFRLSPSWLLLLDLDDLFKGDTCLFFLIHLFKSIFVAAEL